VRRAVVVAFAALAVAGCGGDDVKPAPREQAPAPPRAETVRFKASDGRAVSARYTPAAGDRAPAVVLLHEIRGGPDQWDTLVPDLHEAGFATLAYESRASVMERDRVRDVLGAVRWLRRRPDVDRGRLEDHARYHPHDVLMVSDEREATAVDGMMDGAVRSQALRSQRPGHGVALLAEPRIRAALVAWLRERVR
jgi:hypothetical protein